MINKGFGELAIEVYVDYARNYNAGLVDFAYTISNACKYYKMINSDDSKVFELFKEVYECYLGIYDYEGKENKEILEQLKYMAFLSNNFEVMRDIREV